MARGQAHYSNLRGPGLGLKASAALNPEPSGHGPDHPAQCHPKPKNVGVARAQGSQGWAGANTRQAQAHAKNGRADDRLAVPAGRLGEELTTQ